MFSSNASLVSCACRDAWENALVIILKLDKAFQTSMSAWFVPRHRVRILKKQLKRSYLQMLLLLFTKVCLLLLLFVSSFFLNIPFSCQERVIENLREQKEHEDRTRLEELDQMRKENQELKDKLTALQPPNTSQSQPANPGVTQNQRPDREVGTDKSLLQNGCCVDDRRHHQYSQIIQNKIQITAEEGARSYKRRGRPIKAVCFGMCFDGRNISLLSKS